LSRTTWGGVDHVWPQVGELGKGGKGARGGLWSSPIWGKEKNDETVFREKERERGLSLPKKGLPKRRGRRAVQIGFDG